jgi:hypothetical protein
MSSQALPINTFVCCSIGLQEPSQPSQAVSWTAVERLKLQQAVRVDGITDFARMAGGLQDSLQEHGHLHAGNA